MNKTRKASFGILLALIILLQAMILPIGASESLGGSQIPLGFCVFGFYASNPASQTFDISEGNITMAKGFSANTLKVTYGNAQTLDNIPITSPITLTGHTTTNTVVVDGTGLSGSVVKITLSNLSINVSNTSTKTAFDITSANVDMELVGISLLNSGHDRAGIRVSASAGGQLTIHAADNNQSLTVASSNGALFGQGNSAGIGGNNGPVGGSSGKITILRGTVNASSGDGAGIGGGAGLSTIGGNGTTIEILGGVVNATSIRGAAIGGGHGKNNGGPSSAITIENATVTANSNKGAAIGAGSGDILGGMSGGVTIKSGTINATSIIGAGIGSGGSPNAGGTAGSITISGGTIHATSNQGAGIGSGGGGVAGGEMGGLALNGGIVVARSNSGAAIGGGAGSTGAGGNCNNIQITGGVVNAVSMLSAGVGGGRGAVMGDGGMGVLDGGELYRSMLHTHTDTNFGDLGGNQIYQISFLVQDKAGIPIPNANVTLIGKTTVHTSDAEGRVWFSLPKPPSPTGNHGSDYSFLFQVTSYQDQTVDCPDITVDPEKIVIMAPDNVGAPTVTANIESVPDWTNNPITVDLTYVPGINGSLKWSDKRYVLSQNYSTPTGYGIYANPISVSSAGEWYLHYAVRDPGYLGGAWQTGTFGPYRFGIDPGLSGSCNITDFSIDGVGGRISRNYIIVPQPYGTNLTSLAPEISMTGVSIVPPSSSAQDFTNPVTYIVTAENGETQQYTVAVSLAAPSDKQITSFTVNGVQAEIVGSSILLTLPYGTDMTALAPVIVHTGSSVSPASGTIQDFTNPVSYTITAIDNTTQIYTIQTTVVGGSEIIEPTVDSPNPIHLALPASTTTSISLDMGVAANGIDNLAQYAVLSTENTALAGAYPARMFDDGKATLTGLAAGTTNLVVTFYDRHGTVLLTMTIPVVIEDNNGDSGNSGGNSGGSGNDHSRGTTRADQSGQVATSGRNCSDRPYTYPIGKKAFEELLKTASPSNTLVIKAKNYSGIDLSVLQALQALAEKSSVSLSLQFDIQRGNVVQSRLYINPAKATKSFALCPNEQRAQTVEAMLRGSYQNNLFAYTMSMRGELGQKIHIAVKLPDKFSTKQIVIYYYDDVRKGYALLPDANQWIDDHGYIRFDSTYGGDFVFSDGPLQKK